LMITEYLNTADWKEQINTFRGIYRERRDAMLGALADYLPQLSWTIPNGGFYIWATLPSHLDSKAMLPRAVKELVAYTPGTAFYADGSGRNNIRLSFCYPTPEFIREGIRRLSTVINGEIDLLNTFSQTTPLATIPLKQGIASPPPNTD
jgi:2-aminoadipate transaminase